jgi:AraC-like DNA-binding protein
VSRNLLSQAINERTGQNFYDFVNFYRVETVKERLKDPEKRDMNVLHIAFDAGFNTKATFNAVFKKSTGLTPSQYRKNFEAAEGSAPATPMTLQ